MIDDLHRFARRARLVAIGALCLAGAPGTGAQEMPAVPVRYTVTRDHPVVRIVRLPGTVESRTLSLVASEVDGLVVELPVREGRSVRQGEPLARLRSTSLELRLAAATAELKEARARAGQAERALERARDLLRSGVASQQQYDDALSESTARQGRVEQLEAESERLRFDVEHCTVRAPFAGTVVAERTEVGEWIRVGSPVVEMASLDELEVRVEVPERHFRHLKRGSPATILLEAEPGRTLEGRISAIIPRADPQARTFPVKIRIPNREGRIAVGMLTQVSLPAGESYRATIVPKDALINQGRETIVYLLNGDSTVTRAAVEAGAGVGEWIAVSGPVAPGQKVVTRGNERLQPGQKVRGEPLEYDLP
jgi:RND family efflux transporter MFP subunit